MRIKDRILRLDRLPANQLLPHPKNWRTHPPAQLNALKATLSEIGWADALLVRETAEGLQLIDGHARAEVAPDTTVPVLVVDLTDEEAEVVLATHDPLAQIAETDQEKLDELLDKISTKSEALQEMLAGLRVDQWAISETEFPELPSGSKSTAGTMSFSVTEDQRDTIQAALKKAKEKPFEETGNENSNGNALWRVARGYLGEC